MNVKKFLSAFSSGAVVVGSMMIAFSHPITADAFGVDGTYDVFEYTYYGGYANYVVITGCDKSVTSVEIPSEIEGWSVECIDSYAFQDCTELVSVVIPDSVESMSIGAFSGCTSLTDIVIPDGVTYIGSETFSGCTSLSKIVIPNSVESIDVRAFIDCTNLSDITISNSVTSIGMAAFYNCTSLESITIPDSVTSLGDGVFENCSSLASVTISDSVTGMGMDVFLRTPFLENQTTDVKYAGKWAVDCNEEATEAEVLSGIEGIAPYAFHQCYKLTKVTLPDTLRTIGHWSFSYCNNLEKIYIPASAESIDVSAFDCSGIKEISVDEANQVYCSADGVLFSKDMATLIRTPCDFVAEEYVIPEDVQHIGKDSFDSCHSIDKIIMPEGLVSIGEYAFQDCRYMTEFDIPEGVISIGDSAFRNCEALERVSFPASLETLGEDLFGQCGFFTLQLTEINVAEDNQHFCDVDGVLFDKAKTTLIKFPANKDTQNYIVPDGVIRITKDAFDYINNLQSITLPDGFTTIDPGAFAYAELTSITIPESVTKIDKPNFYGCANLTIRCAAGSAAEAYAIENNIAYALIDTSARYQTGDVDGDSAVSVSDAAQALAMYAKNAANLPLDEYTTTQLNAADVNGDGNIDISDATAILAYYAQYSANLNPSWEDIIR